MEQILGTAVMENKLALVNHWFFPLFWDIFWHHEWKTLSLHLPYIGCNVSLVVKPFKITICVGFTYHWYQKDYIFLWPAAWGDKTLFFLLSEPWSSALTPVPIDSDEQAGLCCCGYTCQPQEAHVWWQECRFGSPILFYTWSHLQMGMPKVTRLEEVTMGVGAKRTSWHAEGAWRPSMWALWTQIKLCFLRGFSLCLESSCTKW